MIFTLLLVGSSDHCSHTDALVIQLSSEVFQCFHWSTRSSTHSPEGFQPMDGIAFLPINSDHSLFESSSTPRRQ
jgi:hypothetical protein